MQGHPFSVTIATLKGFLGDVRKKLVNFTLLHTTIHIIVLHRFHFKNQSINYDLKLPIVNIKIFSILKV